MKNKSTHKKVRHHRRNTRKNGKYGGMNRGLNPSAAEWRPAPPQLNIMQQFQQMMRQLTMNAVAIDCEMVGVGLEGRTSALAHVAIIDFFGNQIYNKYVIPRGGINSIVNYRHRYSGITRNILENPDNRAESFEVVKAEVHALLRGKTIVGHGLINDFTVLEYNPVDPNNYNTVWDTTTINLYMQNNSRNMALPEGERRRSARKLKALSMEISGNNIQRNEINNQGNPIGHSPLEDARASMNLYRKAHGFDRIIYTNMATNIYPLREEPFN